MSNKKNNYIVLLSFCLFIIIITIISIIIYNSPSKAEEYDSSNSSLINGSSTNLKRNLMKDENFIILSKIPNPNHKDYTSMIVNMLRIIDHNYFTIEGNNYKISRNDFNQAFYELYGIKIDDLNISVLSGLKTINEINQDLLIDLEQYPSSDNLVLIGVETITEAKNALLAKIKIYDFYTNDDAVEAKITAELETAVLRNKTLNQDLIDEYAIDVQSKEILFKENSNSKFFKYQILNAENNVNEDNLISKDMLIFVYIAIGVLVIIALPVIYIKVKNSNA